MAWMDSETIFQYILYILTVSVILLTILYICYEKSLAFVHF